ncbi:ssRNA exonuclease RAT1 KNAG_0L01770 [Huiozyma naganishii CBS 8797]|uniref:5'-3' exoribonuclease n=1 Tax=Huiozyma naganishii (strain ATCC MYA-139 / BCRC 22969 / CBS 8797 / KCTC 17520 / NBRC 10181 / NCYC 3082 / Yp74L-3) TaxID=1071383 RepID=J7SB69_HUIN7|nr:hypothetical protein KNAG_0L01770 [Kazachstania naganishii CBS 8797]CCK72796.1 hypothetical protein KNAG_0L01770 [Kazachstania naganishii CBS 8797]
MGVPSFFRWLSRKYPKIISPVLEERPQIVDGVELPIDYSTENANGELDNLYLDMNGIVHPCSHPENKPPPETEDEMLLAVFEYTHRVLNMARPRKVLVMAVDGVAPRAKMNQQRARRLGLAKDAELQNEKKEEELRKREHYGEVIDDSVKAKKTWDSNAITPGTPFMDKLALALRYWTAFKLATDPGWKNLQVVISDATVPGEGEHKIMNFIRSQRADPEYNPNTSHCIYGLDADLIFLGLATHEPHFKILREDVFAQEYKSSKRDIDANNMTEEERQILLKRDAEKPFLWLHIGILREYLAAELFVPRLPFAFDLERAIDDWVFMCFFCGNDFLPHLPCLDVRENSIDILLDIWKKVLPSMKTYMTCDGQLNLASVEVVLRQLGAREPDIFQTKYIQTQRNEARYRQNNKRNGKNVSKGQDRHPTKVNEQLQMYDTSGNLAKGAWNLTTSDMVRLKKEVMLANEGDDRALAVVREQSEKNNKMMQEITEEDMDKVVDFANKNNFSVAETLKKKLAAKKHQLEEKEAEEDEKEAKVVKKFKSEDDDLKAKIKAEVEDEVDNEERGPLVSTPEQPTSIISSSELTGGVIDTDDTVRLHESGYKERYYTGKFNISKDQIEPLRKDMVKSYIEGVSWVLLYYYQGCPSWNWYYPYHYAPFAADFFDINDIKVEFKQGEPFLPYEQLMSVLPAASGHTLPPIFRPLMSDVDSPIIDFYPQEFKIDMNGKKMSWQGIALLPFIDEKRLLETVRAQYPKLSEEERARNCRNEDILLISNKNANYEKFVKKLYKDSKEHTDVLFRHFKTGLSGIVATDVEGFTLNGKLPCPVHGGSLPELSTNLFLKMLYKMLPLPGKNKSLLLNGYIPSKPVLTPYDLESVFVNKSGYGRNRRGFGGSPQYTEIPTGPYGTTQYSPRVGGYRSFFYFASNSNNNNNANKMGNRYNGNNNYNQQQNGPPHVNSNNDYRNNRSGGYNPERNNNYRGNNYRQGNNRNFNNGNASRYQGSNRR